MRFFSIDVETANPNMASICQVGVAEYQDEKLVREWVSLVDPDDYFCPVNVSIHGIDEPAVVGAPIFEEVYEQLASMLEGNVVVCHTHFDRVALTQACDLAGLTPLDVVWLDSAKVARRAWSQFAQSGYGLSSVASFIGYEFKHHDALEDAKAAGEILLAAVRHTQVSVSEWLERVERTLAGLPRGSSGIKSMEGDPNGPLAGETVVFTGSLSIRRQDAADLAVKFGCNVGSGVTKKTTLLVVGDQDVTKLAGEAKSSKHRKAESLIKSGQKMRILTESDFAKLVELA